MPLQKYFLVSMSFLALSAFSQLSRVVPLLARILRLSIFSSPSRRGKKKKRRVMDFFYSANLFLLPSPGPPLSCWESRGNAVSFPALLKSMLSEREKEGERDRDRYIERQGNKSEV